MSARAVEGVFFWPYTITPHMAVYGRPKGSTRYTKDYLQSNAGQYPLIDEVLHRASDAEPLRLEIRWPGGHRAAYWLKSPSDNDNRCRLGWATGVGAPTPWRMGDPFTDPAATIPGNPDLTTEAGADGEFNKVKDLGINPVIVAIKLAGEHNVLHARAYLRNPPAGLEHRGIDTLPAPIRSIIKATPIGESGGILLSPGGTVRAPDLVRRILDALTFEPNVLLVGPPGTGKTVALEDLRAIYEGRVSTTMFDPEKWDGEWSELAPTEGAKVVSLVFHPSYSYEEFVAGLVPAAVNGVMTLEARPGPLLSLAHYCDDGTRPGLLLLDEFNRAPAAAVFGNMLALLDKEKRASAPPGPAGVSISRPHAGHGEMRVPPAYKKANGNDLVPDEVRLPDSLRIVAALNSTDRSVAPLDAALRRRFAVVRVSPDYAALAAKLDTQWPPAGAAAELPANLAEWTLDQARGMALRLLLSLNSRIESLLGEDFLLGHALLWSVSGTTPSDVVESLAKTFDQKIAATLRMTFADQDEALAAVLKVGPLGSVVSGPQIAQWIASPPELEGVASPRLRIIDAQSLGPEQAAAALRALL